MPLTLGVYTRLNLLALHRLCWVGRRTATGLLGLPLPGAASGQQVWQVNGLLLCRLCIQTL